MKLRLHHQQLRFRLSPSDIDRLKHTKSLKETLSLAPNVNWLYSLELSGGISTTELFAEPMTLKLRLPEDEFVKWLDGHEIEWSFAQQNPQLEVMVEKDLKPHRSA